MLKQLSKVPLFHFRMGLFFDLGILILGRQVLRPRHAPLFSKKLVVHRIFLLESLGDSEDVLVFFPLNVDVVQSVLQQSDFFLFLLEFNGQLWLSHAPVFLIVHDLFLQTVGLDKEK